MSLSVRVRASSTSGSRASSRKYGDFTRDASTRLSRWRAVIFSASIGSSHGSQSSMSRVKTVGTVWPDWGTVLSVMRASHLGRQYPKAGDDTDLESEEGDELGERHHVGGRPAGIEQRLQRRRRGIARMEHQHVRVLERRHEATAQRQRDIGRDLVDQSRRVLDAERPLRIGPIGAFRLACRQRECDRGLKPGRPARLAESRTVEGFGLRLAVEARHEAGHGAAFLRAHAAHDFWIEQRQIARLRLLARDGAPVARRVELRARRDIGQRVYDVSNHLEFFPTLSFVFRRPCAPPPYRAASRRPAPPSRPSARSNAGYRDAAGRWNGPAW